MDYNNPRIAEKIGKMEKQLHNFGEILQKFGLDLIQSIGEMKHNLSVLSDKVEKIENELIELKGLRNQLQENNRLREEIIVKSNTIEKQVRLLNSKMDQFQQGSFPNDSLSMLSNPTQSQSVNKKGSTNEDSNNPEQIIQKYLSKIENLPDYKAGLQFLKKLREEIYLATGGHRILLEIRSFEKTMEEQNKKQPWESIQADLRNKLKKWNDELN